MASLSIDQLLQDLHNVRDFGARGDGNGNDAPAIQHAMNHLAARGGGILYVPPGTYALSSSPSFSGLENVTLWLANGVSSTGAGSFPSATGTNGLFDQRDGAAPLQLSDATPAASAPADAGGAGDATQASRANHEHPRESLGSGAADPAAGDHEHGVGGYTAAGVSDHPSLTGVTPNQHHAQAHAHDGVDGSGTVAHSATSGKTANDHHTESHAHDGVDGSGTVAHSATSGKTANDHHTENHATRHQPGGADAMAVDAAAATGSLRTLGTGANQAAAGNHTHTLQQEAVAGAETDTGPTSRTVTMNDLGLGGQRDSSLNLAISKTSRAVGVASGLSRTNDASAATLKIFIDGVEVGSTSLANLALGTISGTREVAAGTRAVLARIIGSSSDTSSVLVEAGGGAVSV